MSENLNWKRRVMLWDSYGYVHIGNRKHLSYVKSACEKLNLKKIKKKQHEN